MTETRKPRQMVTDGANSRGVVRPTTTAKGKSSKQVEVSIPSTAEVVAKIASVWVEEFDYDLCPTGIRKVDHFALSLVTMAVHDIVRETVEAAPPGPKRTKVSLATASYLKSAHCRLVKDRLCAMAELGLVV